MFEYLEHHYNGIRLSFIQAAFAKLTTFKTKSALTFASNNLMSACQVAGAATGTAIPSLRTAVTEGAEAVADVVTISGYNAAVRSISFAIGSTVAVGSSVIIELPFFARGIYKTYRKKKIDQITTVESKKEYTKQIYLSAGMVVGGASGAMVGTLISRISDWYGRWKRWSACNISFFQRRNDSRFCDLTNISLRGFSSARVTTLLL